MNECLVMSNVIGTAQQRRAMIDEANHGRREEKTIFHVMTIRISKYFLIMASVQYVQFVRHLTFHSNLRLGGARNNEVFVASLNKGYS